MLQHLKAIESIILRGFLFAAVTPEVAEPSACRDFECAAYFAASRLIRARMVAAALTASIAASAKLVRPINSLLFDKGERPKAETHREIGHS